MRPALGPEGDAGLQGDAAATQIEDVSELVFQERTG
jgi:hypothetical protein